MEGPSFLSAITYTPGGVLGDMDFFLGRRRSLSALVVHSEGAEVLELDAEAALHLARAEPHLLNMLHVIVLQSSYLSVERTLDALAATSL